MLNFESLPPQLPKLYDFYRSQQYSLSYEDFIIELLQLVFTNKQFLLYKDNTLQFNFDLIPEYEQLRLLVDNLKLVHKLHTELEVYQNEELTLLQYHFSILKPFLTKNKVKVPSFEPKSFSEAHNSLISISSLLN